ncbi:hypothetical protein [Bradyrhizobium manausense]|uniref:Peptidase M41 domain-containing protein n=1 Tax=Bradyrhizobium manausense TaxID=989370 RepID=A0A0R3D9Q5_9BRAD|nr:hypothetical protein [Bradyrhizobium manausense]KRQ03295.1 hypothetical protein AOQ71_31705 [Bradyrhizobium manausense]
MNADSAIHTALHEAGHILACFVLSIPLASATVVPDTTGALGSVTPVNTDAIPLPHAVAALAAGAVIEKDWLRNADVADTCLGDFKSVRGLLEARFGTVSADEASQCFFAGMALAKSLLTGRDRELTEIAVALCENHTLDSEQLSDLKRRLLQ